MNIINSFSSFSSNDIPSCITFYRDTLGLPLDESMGGFELSLPGGSTFIYPKSNHTPATFTVLNFVVENIDDAVDELTEKGVTFERYDDGSLPAPQDDRAVLRGKEAGMGPNIAWFKDPSGNILSLTEQ